MFAPALGAQEAPAGDYYVYVAAESEDEVALIRFGPDGAEVVERIAVGIYPTEMDGPHGLTVDAAGERWYVSIAHGNPFGQVHVYSTEDNRRIGRVEVGLFPASMSLTPTNLMFVVNFNLHGDPEPSSVSVIETESLIELLTIPTCETPHGSRLTADGLKNYVVCVRDEQLVEIDALELAALSRHGLCWGKARTQPPQLLS